MKPIYIYVNCNDYLHLLTVVGVIMNVVPQEACFERAHPVLLNGPELATDLKFKMIVRGFIGF